MKRLHNSSSLLFLLFCLGTKDVMWASENLDSIYENERTDGDEMSDGESDIEGQGGQVSVNNEDSHHQEDSDSAHTSQEFLDRVNESSLNTDFTNMIDDGSNQEDVSEGGVPQVVYDFRTHMVNSGLPRSEFIDNLRRRFLGQPNRVNIPPHFLFTGPPGTGISRRWDSVMTSEAPPSPPLVFIGTPGTGKAYARFNDNNDWENNPDLVARTNALRDLPDINPSVIFNSDDTRSGDGDISPTIAKLDGRGSGVYMVMIFTLSRIFFFCLRIRMVV